MSLTLIYRGKNARFSMQLAKLHWLSAVVAFSLLSGVIIHLVISSNDIPANAEQYNQPELPLSEQIVAKKDAQITALTIKMAELQSQVLRLNALGDRLATEAKIPKKEFNFEQLPPTGGPVSGEYISANKPLPELMLELEQLSERVEDKEKQLSLLESLSLGLHIQSKGYLSGRPISKGWLSSYYGMRKDPFTGRPAMHKGIDFAGKEGASVIATASGVVSWADERYGYGQLVEIDHGKGLKTRYGHNKALLVEVGDVVSKGQVIAKMGSTGRSTGPHVHYEILRNDQQINPLKYVYRKAK